MIPKVNESKTTLPLHERVRLKHGTVSILPRWVDEFVSPRWRFGKIVYPESWGRQRGDGRGIRDGYMENWGTSRSWRIPGIRGRTIRIFSCMFPTVKGVLVTFTFRPSQRRRTNFTKGKRDVRRKFVWKTQATRGEVSWVLQSEGVVVETESLCGSSQGGRNGKDRGKKMNL